MRGKRQTKHLAGRANFPNLADAVGLSLSNHPLSLGIFYAGAVRCGEVFAIP